MNKHVTVKINVLGVSLAINQVDALLANHGNAFEMQRDWLTSFFQLENSSELVRSVLLRYAEADKVMARISVGTNDEDIYKRLIGTLASSKRCFSNGEYLACIELCALHSEMLANYLCITDKMSLEKTLPDLSKKDRESIAINKDIGIYFSDKIPQTMRLRWLFKSNIISSEDKKRLFRIHNLRIGYFHRWSSKRGREKQDALNALSLVSLVTARFLEILGSKPGTKNIENLNRVKRYMEIVSR